MISSNALTASRSNHPGQQGWATALLARALPAPVRASFGGERFAMPGSLEVSCKKSAYILLLVRIKLQDNRSGNSDAVHHRLPAPRRVDDRQPAVTERYGGPLPVSSA